MERWLVAGLGNPGSEYARNRHNVGFLFLDYLLQRLAAGSFSHQRAIQGERATARLKRTPLLLLKPQTFMNLSGASVQAALAYFKILSEHTVICYDDVDIPFGTFRIRLKGSSGGHRGIASIIEHLGPAFVRLRFGIKPEHGRTSNLANFVLSDFHQDELTALSGLFDEAFEALKLVVNGRGSLAMNKYNRRVKPDAESSKEQA